MRSAAARLTWLPPAAVGAAAAACAEVAVGLLLYVRGGLLGALTVLLAVEALALGLGLWSAPRDDAPPWAAMRRAWFILLFALLAGAAVAAGWESLGGLSSTWLARGLGLACLAALPLYAAGAVLGASALTDADRAAVGPAAAAGAALGFALVGAGRGVLRVAPLAYVSGVVAVAVGALVHGAVLEERERRWREWAEHGTGRDDADARPPLRDRREPHGTAPPSPGPRA